MLFVVVQLIKPKTRIVVPESFIYDLNEESLKNNGCNHNFSYLIYWSKHALGDGSNTPDTNWVPNFNAPLSDVYPPENDLAEVCYKGALKHFFGKHKLT